jgi:formylglycine-generating enzyme required for sulfatase activity
MKTFKLACLLALTLAVSSRAEEARFFRISGPVPTTITAFRADGTMVWTNAQPGATYTIQTVTFLPGGTNWMDYIKIPTANDVNTNLLVDCNSSFILTLIPSGSFTMGDTLDGTANASPTNVTVSAFYMDVNLVSYSQWQGVYNWATSHGYGFVNAGAGKATNHPVQTVDWYDVVKWCNARSQQAGLTPVYYTDAGLTQVYTNGEVTVYVNWTAKGYRLPTEAEWERAARGGLCGQRFPWGNTISESQANYKGDTNSYSYDLGPNGYNTNYATGVLPYTSPVGSFASNGYGLNDMAGNVRAWCWDWYGTPYGQPTTNNPTGPGTESRRVQRGGNWGQSAASARCANRGYSSPGIPGNLSGFRCVRGQ